MNYRTPSPIGRAGLAVCTLAIAALTACSDSTSPSSLRAPAAALNDRGGPGGQSGRDASGDQGNDGNQNGQRTRVSIALVAPTTAGSFARAHGTARLDTRPGQTQLEIEVDHLPLGTVVRFFVGSQQVGAATIGAGGEAEVELSTERGDMIPSIGAGVVVSARTAGGQLIASGSF